MDGIKSVTGPGTKTFRPRSTKRAAYRTYPAIRTDAKLPDLLKPSRAYTSTLGSRSIVAAIVLIVTSP